MGAAVGPIGGAAGDELGGDAQREGEQVAEQQLDGPGPWETLQGERRTGLGQRADEQGRTVCVGELVIRGHGAPITDPSRQ